MTRKKKDKPKKLSRKAKKAAHVEALKVLEAAKADVAKKELASIAELVAKIIHQEQLIAAQGRRLAALEDRVGIPGPKGDAGPRGAQGETGAPGGFSLFGG